MSPDMIPVTITSLSFIAFLVIAAFVYYVTPKKKQWVTLLALSIFFYCLAAVPYTIVFIIISTLTVYFSALYSEKNREHSKKAAAATIAAVLINTVIWFLFKGTAYWEQLSAVIHSRIPAFPQLSALPVAAALGMGYYTCQAIGYTVDCSWGTAKPQKNFFKLLLFLIFFPQLITGPISHYNTLLPLYEGRDFDLEKASRGAQRILWGLFKKLVISERVAIFVNAVYGNGYTGLWIVMAVLFYPLQLYTDFSGSVDIVLGTAEIFGIDLPENFNNPFFSRTSQEFWQRWHMSLGSWAKDYVMYPVLKSERVLFLSDKVREKHGKRAGKLCSLGIGMFCTWMVMGIWHGNYKYILGCGLYYWAVMLLYEMASPLLKKVNEFLGVKEESFSWGLFCMVRTYLVLCISLIFFRAEGISDGIRTVKELFAAFTPAVFNPWIFFNGELLTAGLTDVDFHVIWLSVLILIIVALLREKYGYARNWAAAQGRLFRWGVWLMFIMLVVVYGKYGPGYHAADFIYQGF